MARTSVLLWLPGLCLGLALSIRPSGAAPDLDPLEALLAQDPERATWERVRRRFDADDDGEVTRDEFPRPFLFRRLDTDRDGVLTAADWDAADDGASDTPGTPAAPSTPKAEDAAEASPEALALFRDEVLPLLEGACFDCHSSEARRVRGGFRADSRAALLRGGPSGPGVVPGDPDASLLIEAVRYTDPALLMPPDGRLADEELAVLERWVELGAPWPDAATRDAAEASPGAATDIAAPDAHDPWASTIAVEAGRAWWSFRPIGDPAPPAVDAVDRDWVRSPVDAFLLADLRAAGLSPTGDAERGAWLRRVTFDLTGLPPTPEELAAFEADREPGADARVVDRLLASPRYGERWGRHWLDVARYAESSGRDSNVIYPHAWRYRDWVVDAFTRDMPYDEFLLHQLAGDLLEGGDADERAARHVATGYLALGPKSHNTRDRRQFELDVADEQIDALTQGVLGLTVACARCHDHKFDPIASRDYYALAGIFLSTDTLYGTPRSQGNNRPGELYELPREADLVNGPAMQPEVRRALERLRARSERTLADAVEPAGRPGRRPRTPDPNDGDAEDDGGAMSGAPSLDELRVQAIRQRAARDNLAILEDLLERFDENGRALPANRLAMGLADGRAGDANLLGRGELENRGPKVPRGIPEVLADGVGLDIPRRASGRLELARWVTSPDNPLTARVWANRVWAQLFGRGLVPTPNNLGASGQAPTHPELLDWLARRLVDGGWSTKALVRELVLSRAYRLAVDPDHGRDLDPENRLYGSMPARRLEAEALRDAMLLAAGTLTFERPAGSPVGTLEGRPRREEVLARVTAERPVRSVWLPVLRDRVPPSLELFDCADPSFVSGTREETIVPTQALYLMNDADVLAASDALAARLARTGGSAERRIQEAFERTLSRPASGAEVTLVKRFLKDFARLAKEERDEAPEPDPREARRGRFRRDRAGRPAAPPRLDPEQAAWSAFVQSLFQSAEFRYRG